MFNRRALVVCSLVLSLALGAAAQWTNEKKSKPRDRSIRDLIGVVTLPDESFAEGAVVKLKNMKTLQVRSYITQTDGKYRFTGLSSSIDFEIQADFKNLQSDKRTLSVYDSRLDPVINLKLEPKDQPKPKEDEKQ
jgi:hypothetical protein